MSETKLTKAQMICLGILASNADNNYGGWVGYGRGCGVKRNVVRALRSRGLADLRDDERQHVSARITPAGRAALAKAEGRS